VSRRRKRSESDAFGASFADVLATALGCVLLLFLAAMTIIKSSLLDEKAEHATTQAELALEATGRETAEKAKLKEKGQRTAVERTLAQESAALAEARQRVKDLQASLAGVTFELNHEKSAKAEAMQRFRGLRDATRTAAQELDPKQASPVDVVMVIDGTRSMQPSLDATRRNLISTVQALRVVSPTARVGVVVFRDKREARRIRLESHPLTENERDLARFLQNIEATSTKADTDRAEWLCDGGLRAGAAAAWRDEAIKLMIVVSDADAQRPKACAKVAREFAAKGGHIYMLSNLPEGYNDRRQGRLRRIYRDLVLPQHAEIANLGAGLHVKGAEADALLTEVLRAAFRSRTEISLDALNRAINDHPPLLEDTDDLDGSIAVPLSPIAPAPRVVRPTAPITAAPTKAAPATASPRVEDPIDEPDPPRRRLPDERLPDERLPDEGRTREGRMEDRPPEDRREADRPVAPPRLEQMGEDEDRPDAPIEGDGVDESDDNEFFEGEPL
jgi:hypothetical protein